MFTTLILVCPPLIPPSKELAINFPHLNRLTGLRWWRRLPRSDSSDSFRRISEENISVLLRSRDPCAIGKIGTTELMGLEYLTRMIRLPWPPKASWRRPARRLHDCSGLFPIRKDIFLLWSEAYRKALSSMDVIAQWQTAGTYLSVVEDRVLARYAPRAFRAHRNFIHPLHPPPGWLADLVRLRWLVVHPFEKTIQSQLPRLGDLGVYPQEAAPFLRERSRDTQILASPQFAYMVSPRHRDWHHALEAMTQDMERQKDRFDVALIGAGAWSLPLAAHAKKIGRKAIHLGGATQLLFGIRGRRFDQWGYTFHQSWVRPVPEETPAKCNLMEGGAYW